MFTDSGGGTIFSVGDHLLEPERHAAYRA